MSALRQLNLAVLLSTVLCVSCADEVHEEKYDGTEDAREIMQAIEKDKDGLADRQKVFDHFVHDEAWTSSHKDDHHYHDSVREKLKTADADGDSKLSMEELQHFLVMMHQEEEELVEDKTYNAEEMMKEIGRSKDALLSRQEVFDHLKDHEREVLTEQFDAADKNQDGMLSLQELKRLWVFIHHPRMHFIPELHGEDRHEEDEEEEHEYDIDHEEEAMELMKDYDADKDGLVTFHEVFDELFEGEQLPEAERKDKRQRAEKVFKEADDDRDGKLNVEELEQMIAIIHNEGHDFEL